MTVWRRWRPLDGSQIARVREAVGLTLTEWVADWLGARAQSNIAQGAAATADGKPGDRAVDAAGLPQGARTISADQPHPVLAIEASGSTRAPLAVAALAPENDSHGAGSAALALLDNLERRMLLDLRTRLARTLRIDDADATFLPTRGQQISVYAEVTGSGGQVAQVCIRVDTAALPRRLRAGPALVSELSSRWDAIGPESIAVRVEIGRGHVNALDVLRLKPGDVLLANRGIDAPIEVNLGDRRLGWGYPCRVGDRKAVQLSVEAQEAKEDGKR
jgi:flagellar motor switch/type III secretory pathway protein FliN